MFSFQAIKIFHTSFWPHTYIIIVAMASTHTTGSKAAGTLAESVWIGLFLDAINVNIREIRNKVAEKLKLRKAAFVKKKECFAYSGNRHL